MSFSKFMRVEREGGACARHTVVHTDDPKFALELVPDDSAPDGVGRGVMKRLRVPNSWAGEYTSYAKFISVAQEFFVQSLGPAMLDGAQQRNRGRAARGGGPRGGG